MITRRMRTTAALAAGGGLAALLAGCSMDAAMMDTVMWGPEGARVISTTDALIAAAAAGDGAAMNCADSVAEFGDAEHWQGLQSGEPESFRAGYWEQQAALKPTWNINLEYSGATAEPGESFPSDVFYQRSGDGLCVVDVAWSTRG
ncbi:hypothetical protein ACIQLJ_11955 [Microbacterium sp. NPDC091313]